MTEFAHLSITCLLWWAGWTMIAALYEISDPATPPDEEQE